jgi:hypothetical protein
MGQRRFTRPTNGLSKKLDNHVTAVALYHYNLCRASPAHDAGEGAGCCRLDSEHSHAALAACYGD